MGDGPTNVGGRGGSAGKDDRWAPTLKLVQPKFDAALLSFYQCASIGTTTDGKVCTRPVSKTVKVKVELTSTGAAVVHKLALAGFKVDGGEGTLQLTGSIPTTQLKRLAQIAEVKSVSLNQ